jgi:hypothetical protein
MERHIITRDGLPPISFTGELIGDADNSISRDGNRANRWTEVEIYRTKAGKYVGHVRSLTCWQGERNHDAATSTVTAGELIDWLRKDNDGELGPVSQEAVEEAVKVDQGFAAAWIEEVE